MMDDRWGFCPLVDWYPHKMAPCKVMTADDDCPVYRYFKKLIMEDLKNGRTKTDN